MTHTRSTTKLVATLLTFAMLLGAFTGIFTLGVSAEDVSATITFDDTAKRTTISASQQVWEENGITFTNDKASSTTATNNGGGYYKPVRLYKNSSVTINAPGNITKIEFVCAQNASNIQTSIGTAASVSGSTVTVSLDGTSDTYTFALTAGQVRVSSCTVTYAAAAGGESTCEHVNTTTTTTEPTCTVAGKTVVVCDDCDTTVSTTTIPAIKHNYVDGVCTNDNCDSALPKATFVVPEGANKPADLIADENSSEVIMPAAVTLPESYNGYEFAGWAKKEIDNQEEKPDPLYLANNSVKINQDTTFYAVYTYITKKEVAAVGGVAEKDITQIQSTDKFVITMKNATATYALPSTNGSSKQPDAVVFDKNNIDDSLKWTLTVNDDGSYTFHPNGDTTQWLYCTNDTKGPRVGNTTDSNNYKTFEIDADSGYLKNIVRERYFGVYNNQDWRSYTSPSTNIGGQTLAFYVISEGEGTQEIDVICYTSTPVAAEPSEPVAPTLSNVSVTLGADLKMNYYVTADASYAGRLLMTAAMNCETFDLVPVAVDGGFRFTFAGIAPQCMGDKITATLTLDGEVIATKENYGVLDYAKELLSENPSDATKNLVYNMLAYGAAAQQYANYKTNALVNDGYTAVDFDFKNDEKQLGTSANQNVKFAGATVLFDSVNKIAVTVTAPADANVTVKANGVAMEKVGDYYYTDGITALNFDEYYEITLEVDGVTVQTLEYSVNAYATTMKDSANAKMQALAIALYNYGMAAEAYVNA